MLKNRDKSALWAMFFLGLFSETNIWLIGSIGISELYMFVVAPIMFTQDYQVLRRNGFLPTIILAILSCVGCVMSSVYNNTHPQLFYRGFASAYALFAVPIVAHHFLRRNLRGLNWFFVGAIISALITIFALRNGVEEVTIEKAGGVFGAGELFFSRHFGPLFELPLKVFYLQCPTTVTAIVFTIPFVYTVFTTASGRSGVVVMLISLFLLFFVRRRWSLMRRLKQHIMLIGIVLIMVSISCAQGYKIAARRGWLNDRALDKYEKQVKSSTDPISLLVAGRGEFFVGLIAALDQPFWGHGPWPMDTNGYYGEFLSKYGDDQDYIDYINNQTRMSQIYGSQGAHILPVHSMLIGNWVFFGILGLPFWLYILAKLICLLQKHIDAVPQWFGYFSFLIPSLLWNIFFSPFGGRVGTGISLCVILMAIAVGEKRILLPEEMYREAIRYDK